jgi:general secretion pathway protein B
MSFILDALKKSEAERQRQTGPTLLELRITRPQRRYPLWSLVVGGLLAANIAVLLIFVFNRSPPAVIASTSVPAAAPAAAVRVAAASGPATSPTPVVTTVPPLATATGNGAAAGGAGDVPDASSVPTHNPADYEPALPPGSQAQASPPSSQASAVDYSNLPSISQISGNVPAMQLNLLISSEVASERYALINMQRVHEGDVLADGARVLAITPNGVAMDYRGQDFLLRPGGTAQ